MKKAIKTVMFAVLALALALSVTACGGVERRGGEIERVDFEVDFDLPATYEANLKLLRPDGESELKIVRALVDGFNTHYPKINVSYNNTLSISDYNATVMKQFEADMLPDIIWTDSEKFYFLVSNGVALNLDAFLDEADKNKALENVFDYEKDFTEDFKKMGKYGDYLFAVPRSVDSVVTFYNKDILAAAGVDMSVLRNGWTWDDFLGVCQKVRDYFDNVLNKPNYFPIDANLNWESVAWPIIKSFGGEVINSDGNFSLSAETNAKVDALVDELVSKRFIPAKNTIESGFETGTGAMLFQSAAIDKFVTSAQVGNKFDICSFPLVNGESSYIGYGFAGYALNSKIVSDQTKLNAACAFLSYLMSYEGQQIVAKEGGLTLPSVRADLGIDNPDAEWHKTYSRNFNVEAYVWGSKYKTELDFLTHIDPIFSSRVVGSVKSYVGSYCVSYGADEALKRFKADIDDAFDSVVV